MAQDRICVRAALDQLERDLLFVLIISALGQKNCAHSAAADLPSDAVAVDDSARQKRIQLKLSREKKRSASSRKGPASS